MVEPPLNERAQRQEMAAMMFETFKVLQSFKLHMALLLVLYVPTLDGALFRTKKLFSVL